MSSASPCGASGAGARETARMPSRCSFSASGIEHRLAVAPTRRDDRELTIERDELLCELVVRKYDERLDDALPLAVVAEPARLHERR